MSEYSKETVITHNSGVNPQARTHVETKASNTQSMEYLVYYILGAIEILLMFRLILKISGANPASAFVNLTYTLSQIFVMPFEGIFRKGVAQGNLTTSIFEPSAIVAIIVYAVLAWGIVKLIKLLSGEEQTN